MSSQLATGFHHAKIGSGIEAVGTASARRGQPAARRLLRGTLLLSLVLGPSAWAQGKEPAAAPAKSEPAKAAEPAKPAETAEPKAAEPAKAEPKAAEPAKAPEAAAPAP